MIAGQRINTLLGFDFLSVHYTEVAVAILLKMIFCVFSFSLNIFHSIPCSGVARASAARGGLKNCRPQLSNNALSIKVCLHRKR